MLLRNKISVISRGKVKNTGEQGNTEVFTVLQHTVGAFMMKYVCLLALTKYKDKGMQNDE